jgi:predicted RNase H-like nuclease (RuvC/YqgF family)
MALDPLAASIIVGIISGSSAYASQRAAARASTKNVDTTSRTEMEREAYERARNYDTSTIQRLTEEIKELRQENKELRDEVLRLTNKFYPKS